MALYLDNAATTKIHKKVLDAMIESLDFYGNSEAKYYEVAEKAKLNILESRNSISKLVGCDAENVIFTSGATESNNLIIKGLAEANPEKKKIIISDLEHSSVLEPCKYLEQRGYEIVKIKVDRRGLIDLNELNKVIDNKTLMVSVIWVNNEIGTIQDMKSIDNICLKHNVFLHSDATQAVGKIAINLSQFKALKSITFSSHKIYGPKGIGSLILKKDDNGLKVKLTPLFHGGEQENGYRAGTLSNELIVGFGVACEMLIDDVDHSNKILLALEKKLISKLQSKFADGMIINNDWDCRVPGLLNVQFVGYNNSILLKNVSSIFAASTGSSCSVSKPSHVLKAIGLDEKSISYSVRLSLSKYTKIEDLEILEKL